MALLVKAERFSFTSDPFVRRLGYSGAEADRCSSGMGLWESQGNFRSRSGPGVKFRGLARGCSWKGLPKEKADPP